MVKQGPMRIGINGFGRIGRLVFRALWGRPGIEICHVNDPSGDAATAAHLLEFDSVHGRWDQLVGGSENQLLVNQQTISYSQGSTPGAVPWNDAGIDIVLECSGKFKSPETLSVYFDQHALKRVIVACPVKGKLAGKEVLNIVYGINHHLYDPKIDHLVTAASCTTNCLAPVVKVVHENFGI